MPNPTDYANAEKYEKAQKYSELYKAGKSEKLEEAKKSGEEEGRMRKYSYLIMMETNTPKDLEDVIQNEFVRIVGHRNKIILYRCRLPHLSREI